MEKKKALQRWRDIPADQPILPHFTPIAADAKGSTFGACGIRISGNPEFIDAVLSRLKDLLAAEAGSTRLTLSRQDVKPVAIKNGETETIKKWNNADTNAETCYIQIRERTAKTRQRKVREITAPLFPNEEGTSISGGTIPPTPTPPKAKTPPERKGGGNTEEPDEPRKYVHLGGDDGEVLWD